MIPEELIELIRNGENNVVEFKKSTTEVIERQNGYKSVFK